MYSFLDPQLYILPIHRHLLKNSTSVRKSLKHPPQQPHHLSRSFVLSILGPTEAHQHREEQAISEQKIYHGVPNNSSSSSGFSIPAVCSVRYSCSAVRARICETGLAICGRMTGSGWERLTRGKACCSRFGICRCAVFDTAGMVRQETMLAGISAGIVNARAQVAYNLRALVRRSMFLMMLSPRAARLTSLIRL